MGVKKRQRIGQRLEYSNYLRIYTDKLTPTRPYSFQQSNLER
jgi:hypothetical protein